MYLKGKNCQIWPQSKNQEKLAKNDLKLHAWLIFLGFTVDDNKFGELAKMSSLSSSFLLFFPYIFPENTRIRFMKNVCCCQVHTSNFCEVLTKKDLSAKI